MSKIQLIYFNVPARAQSIRLCFAVGNIAFEDKRVEHAEYGTFMNDFAKCPLGTLPVLSVDGKLVSANSHAIRHYAARLAGLTLDDTTEVLRSDNIEFTCDDIFALYSKLAFERDHAKQKEHAHEFFNGGFQHYAKYVESVLAEGNKAGTKFIGSKLSQADIFAFCVVSFCKEIGEKFGFDPKVLMTPFPHLAALVQEVGAVPAIRDYKPPQA